jgi:hypothetical protein
MAVVEYLFESVGRRGEWQDNRVSAARLVGAVREKLDG